MKQKVTSATENRFKSYGGETRTRLIGGIFFGAVVGLLVGIALVMVWGSSSAQIPGAEAVISLSFQYFLTVFVALIVGATAGATIGIGIPKIKIRPEQGLVKKWKPISVEDEKLHTETIYVPEETRRNRVNNTENMQA